MKVNIENQLLFPFLSKLAAIVGTVETLPAASMILFEANDSQEIILTSTSFEMEMRCQVPEASVAAPGSILLPARRLLDIFYQSPDDAIITISVKGDKANISANDAKYQLNTLPAGDFPLLDPITEKEEKIDIRQDDLKFLLDKTLFSMADNDILHLLNGVMIAVDKKGITLAATDRHRLAVCQTPLENGLSDRTLIVPRKSALEIQKLLKDSESSVKIAVYSKYLAVFLERTIVKIKLAEGDYPDYKRVIPADFAQTISVAKQAFKQTLDRACVVLQGEKRGTNVRLAFGKGELRISATNPEGEESEAKQTLEYAGDPVEIGFNPQYLQEILTVATADEIIFDIKDPSSGVLIREQGLDAVKYVVMPIRL